MERWTDEYATMLVDCKKRMEKLTEWEQGFVESLSESMRAGTDPTPKQIERLDAIWDRATSLR